MEYEKITFVEALQQLGKELSIEVEFSGDEKSKDFLASCTLFMILQQNYIIKHYF